jgi:pSer/pThr/pTyr-binding forkhead associated (FHA) protein
MAQFRFVMRSGPVVGKVFPLDAQEISIGRETTNTIVINDAQVSRRHARMELRSPTYVIQDLGSTNGTFVNGIRISGMQVLTPGDLVTFGEGIVMAYESTTDLNATLLSSMPAQTSVPVHQPAPALTPVAPPAPAPVYPGKVSAGPVPVPPAVSSAPASRPTPPPVYPGKVPSGPVPMPPAAAPVRQDRSRMVIIIVAVAVLLILCLCVGVPLLVDFLKMDCVVPFKYFFNIVGPLFGYGLCP